MRVRCQKKVGGGGICGRLCGLNGLVDDVIDWEGSEGSGHMGGVG